jgi:hypothetical protein
MAKAKGGGKLHRLPFTTFGEIAGVRICATPPPCNGHPRRTGTTKASTVVLFRINSASAELAASKTSNPAARSRLAFAERKTAFSSTTKTTDFSGRGTEAPRG